MNIIVSGGGTGGHLFPGIAIAQEFLKMDPAHRITFMGTARGLEARIVPRLSFALKTIRIKGFSGKGIAGKIDALVSLPVGCWQAYACAKKIQADIVIGVGGYASFPAVIAGSILMIPTVIHEQNSIPGLSNRMLSHIAQRVFVSFEESLRFFQPGKTIFSGLPIRSAQAAPVHSRAEEPVCIFVSGGSQGSREVNRAVCAALPVLRARRAHLRFIHQTGPHDHEQAAHSYKEHGFDARVAPFIEDMYSCYQQAHVVIARAGAATLAELAGSGRAAILIPYPFAAHNHQERNAQIFVDRGAALMIRSGELSGGVLAEHILALSGDREMIARMERQAQSLHRPQAAATIVKECCRLVAQRRNPDHADGAPGHH